MERVGEGATSNVHKGDTEAKGRGERVPFSDIIQSRSKTSFSRLFLFRTFPKLFSFEIAISGSED